MLQDRRDGDCVGGVAVDGVDDENLGNIDGFDLTGDGDIDFPAYFDVTDPTFDVPLAFGRWEQVSGRDDAGSLVYLFEMSGPTTLTNPVVIPYYRDDACLDDGTGDLPVARPWPGETSTDERVVAGYRDRGGFGPDEEVPCASRQGAYGSHGVHFLVTHDTDNGFVGSPAPLTEIDGTQWQWAVPTDAPQAVGDRYAQTRRVPLVPVVLGQGSTTDDGGADDGGVDDGGADDGSTDDGGTDDGSTDDGGTDDGADDGDDGEVGDDGDADDDGEAGDGGDAGSDGDVGDDGGPEAPDAEPFRCRDAGGRFPDDGRPIVGCLVDLGLVQGYPDGTFRPGATVSRRHVVAVLVRYLDALDALDSDASEDPAARLVTAGILQGRADGDLALHEPVSRGQFASLLIRSLDHADLAVPADGPAFADASGSVHEPAARRAAEAELLAGYPDGTARLQTVIPRRQLATILWRAVAFAEERRTGTFAG